MIFNYIMRISENIRNEDKYLKNNILTHYISFYQNTRLFWHA